MRKYTIEEMAIGKAMQKYLKPISEEIDFQAKENLLTLNEDYGAEKIAVNVRGNKVGDITLFHGKEKPCVPVVPSEERDRAYEWLDSHGYLIEQPRKDWESLVDIRNGACFDKETGEVLDFLHINKSSDYVRFNGCKFEDVREAIGYDTDVFTRLLTESLC